MKNVGYFQRKKNAGNFQMRECLVFRAQHAPERLNKNESRRRLMKIYLQNYSRGMFYIILQTLPRVLLFCVEIIPLLWIRLVLFMRF